jgi:hypothetical protein
VGRLRGGGLRLAGAFRFGVRGCGWFASFSFAEVVRVQRSFIITNCSSSSHQMKNCNNKCNNKMNEMNSDLRGE